MTALLDTPGRHGSRPGLYDDLGFKDIRPTTTTHCGAHYLKADL